MSPVAQTGSPKRLEYCLDDFDGRWCRNQGVVLESIIPPWQSVPHVWGSPGFDPQSGLFVLFLHFHDVKTRSGARCSGWQCSGPNKPGLKHPEYFAQLHPYTLTLKDSSSLSFICSRPLFAVGLTRRLRDHEKVPRREYSRGWSVNPLGPVISTISTELIPVRIFASVFPSSSSSLFAPHCARAAEPGQRVSDARPPEDTVWIRSLLSRQLLGEGKVDDS